MRLIFPSQSGDGRVLDVNRGRVTIGRVDDNDVQLAGEKVSRHHAVIELDDQERVVLRDLESRNGTFVDGVRLTAARVLSGGERLTFGDQHARVDAASEPASPEIAPAPAAREAASEPAAREAASEPAARESDFGPADGVAARARRVAGRIRTRTGALLLVAIALVLLVGVAQIVLPGIAEQRLRSSLERYGPVQRVHIASTPAIKLLWHRADRVEVAMDSYASEPGGHGSLADFLSRTRDTGTLDVRVGVLHSQLLTLRAAVLHKSGDVLVGQALLTQKDLSAALPTFLDLRPVSASQEGIVVRVSATVLGAHVAALLRVLADRGRVVVRAEVPFGSLASITVFDDPRVYVESLGATLDGETYALTARARLR